MASKFQNKVRDRYRKDGYLVIKVIKFSDNGYPDLLCIKDGVSTWIECKEATDTLKPLQAYRIDELNKAGCIAICLQDGKGQIYPAASDKAAEEFQNQYNDDFMATPFG